MSTVETRASVEPQKKLEDEVRFEAFCRYQWRCESHEPGSETSDWLAAEHVVLARHAARSEKPSTTTVE